MKTKNSTRLVSSLCKHDHREESKIREHKKSLYKLRSEKRIKIVTKNGTRPKIVYHVYLFAWLYLSFNYKTSEELIFNSFSVSCARIREIDIHSGNNTFLIGDIHFGRRR